MTLEHDAPAQKPQATAHAAATAEDVLAPAAAQLLHRATGTGEMYWGPGDLYTFLVTGAESAGAYFAMEALVPPSGGPPPHIHRNEDETFYVIDGNVEFLLGSQLVIATAGDFVNVPRGTLHRFHNAGAAPARLLVTFSPPDNVESLRRLPPPASAPGRSRRPRPEGSYGTPSGRYEWGSRLIHR